MRTGDGDEREISRLMDGEVDDAEFERCVRSCGRRDAMDDVDVLPRDRRLAARRARVPCMPSPRILRALPHALAAEPTVLAPPRERIRTSQPATFAWAVAATLAAVTVVGWTAFSMVDVPPTAIAKAREARPCAPRRSSRKRTSPANTCSPPGILAAMAIQGGAPYLRAATRTAVEPQPKPIAATDICTHGGHPRRSGG
jgi:hypothetical protein